MSVLSVVWARARSHILGSVGVIAVAGVISSVAAYAYIQRQGDIIEQKDAQIARMIDTIDAQVALRQLEQENTRLLQDKLALIEDRSAAVSEQLKNLEATNAEVREYMARRIPDDLRRLLDQ